MINYRIPDMVKQYTDYEMIQLHTELPDFPEIRTKLLYLFLKQQQSQASSSELYSMVTSLVQMGLDTHDMVTDMKGKEEMGAIRSRQLKVLAGDYFSSNFFYLLSKAGEIGVIKQLSTAICEVNHMKMTLYASMKKSKLTEQEYIQQSVAIRLHLFLSFFSHKDDSNNQIWSELLESFTYCEVIMHELARCNAESLLERSWCYWYILQHGAKEDIKYISGKHEEASKLEMIMEKYAPEARLIVMLEEQWKYTQALIEQIDSVLLRAELLRLAVPIESIFSPLIVEVQ